MWHLSSAYPPLRTMITFSYRNRYLISSAGLVNQPRYFWTGNSIFDPDFSGTGTTVSGLPAWENFYDQYAVYASKISIFFRAEDGSSPGRITLLPTQSLSDMSAYSFEDYTLQRNVKFARFGSHDATYTESDTYGKISHFAKTKQVFGRDIDDQLVAPLTASPSDVWYWALGIWEDYVYGSTGAVLICDVKVKYYCMLLQPHILRGDTFRTPCKHPTGVSCEIEWNQEAQKKREELKKQEAKMVDVNPPLNRTSSFGKPFNK